MYKNTPCSTNNKRFPVFLLVEQQFLQADNIGGCFLTDVFLIFFVSSSLANNLSFHKDATVLYHNFLWPTSMSVVSACASILVTLFLFV